MTHPDEVHEDGYFVDKGGSEMKHIQKDYKLKMHIPREFADQNVVINGERNDEDHAVLSVMKLLEKFTDEEVDEMILETDVDDTQCSEQIAVPVPDTHKVVEKIVKDFQISRSKLRTHRMRRLSQGTTQQGTSEQVVNSVEVKQSEIIKNTVQRKNPIVQQKINQVSKQKGELDPEPAHLTSKLVCQI